MILNLGSVQKFMHAVSGDALGNCNARFGAVNIVFTVIGAATWAVIVLGTIVMMGQKACA